MTAFVTNILQDTLSGFVAGALTSAGEYAGNAVIGLGNLVESGGKAVGDGIAKKFDGWGDGITTHGNGSKSSKVSYSNPSQKVVSKKVDIGSKKPVQKSLPGPAIKKALPAPTQRKAIQGPYTERKGTAAPVKDFKKQGQARSSSVPARTTPTSVKSTTQSKLGGAQSSYTLPKTSGVRRDGATKKVVPEKRSLPSSKGSKSQRPLPSRSSSTGAFKAHIPIGGPIGKPAGSGSKNSSSGYSGPIPISFENSKFDKKADVKRNTGPSKSKTTPSKVSGPAPSKDGYKGPIALGSLA